MICPDLKELVAEKIVVILLTKNLLSFQQNSIIPSHSKTQIRVGCTARTCSSLSQRMAWNVRVRMISDGMGPGAQQTKMTLFGAGNDLVNICNCHHLVAVSKT